MHDAADDFWAHAVALYGAPGVKDACLLLQDGFGLDVNLVLLCCFAGARGHALTEDEWSRLGAFSASWQAEVVGMLRAVRRRRKGDWAPALVRRLLELELHAERSEQQVLIGLLPPLAGASDAALSARNLLRYAAHAPRNADGAQARAAMKTIWEAAHRDVDGAVFDARAAQFEPPAASP